MYPKVTAHYDTSTESYRLHISMDLAYAVSADQVMYPKDKKYLFRHISRQIGKLVADHVEMQLPALLHTPGDDKSPDAFQHFDPAVHLSDEINKHLADEMKKYMVVEGLDKTLHQNKIPWDAPSSNPVQDIYDAINKLKPPPAKKKPHPSVKLLEEAIPGFAEMQEKCPAEDCDIAYYQDPKTPLGRTIIHLNDNHKWTRERIADWLDTLDHNLYFQAPEEVKKDDVA